MSAPLVISIVAILIAIATFIRTERREGRRERRERGREHRDLAESAERRRAKPVVSPQGVSGGSTANSVTHTYSIRNAGQSTITALTLWIGNSGGERVSTLAGGDSFVLAPSDPPQFASIDVPQPIPHDQVLMISWTDADGKHGPESTGIHPPRHA